MSRGHPDAYRTAAALLTIGQFYEAIGESELHTGPSGWQIVTAGHPPGNHHAMWRVDLQVFSAHRDAVDINGESATRNGLQLGALAHPGHPRKLAVKRQGINGRARERMKDHDGLERVARAWLAVPMSTLSTPASQAATALVARLAG